jgi:2-dehydropantoate 2-reductase
MGIYDELCQEVWPEERTRPHFIIGTTTHGGTTFPGQIGYVQHRTAPGEGDIKWGVVADPRREIDFDEWLWQSSASKTPILEPPSSPKIPLPTPPSTETSIEPLYLTLTALLSLSNLNSSLIPMPHLHHQLLLKLALNSIINPLTAIIGSGALPNGSLLQSIPAHRLMRFLAQETSQVLTSYLHSLSSPALPQPDVLRLFSAETLENRAFHLVQSTSKNRSSMASDVHNGRITEINHINGYLISLAKRLGVSTPNHELIVELVKFTTEVNSPNAHSHTRISDQQGLMTGPGGGSMSKSTIEYEHRKLDVVERSLWAKEEHVLEARRERRRIQREYRKAAKAGTGLRRDSDVRQFEEKGKTNSDEDESARTGSTSTPETSSPGTIVTSRSAGTQTQTSTLDQLIASAPRHERTWDVPATPPTARGPLPVRPDVKPKLQRLGSSMSDMMNNAIASASRQSHSVDETHGKSRPLSSTVTSHEPRAHPFDHLIAASPRAESKRDVDGGTITTLSINPSSFARSFISTTLTQTSTLQTTLNDLIAGAPRAERTWTADRETVNVKGVKGRFTTSRNSGS